MITSFFGIKQDQSQAFLEDGTRIPVTRVTAKSLPVISVKTEEKDGYWAIQIGLGKAKRQNKAMAGHTKGANLKDAPRFLREIKITEDTENLPKTGDLIAASDVLKPGDIVDVIATSKGKGFAGVVKRHGFKGGPRTHGQSDRERAPGSIGQTTTPGRVYKGKRMAGRMGQDTVTVRNLKVLAVDSEIITLKGLVPGGKNSVISITKVSEDKKFVPLYKEEVKEPEVHKEEKIETETQAEEKVETQEAQVEESKQEEKENAS